MLLLLRMIKMIFFNLFSLKPNCADKFLKFLWKFIKTKKTCCTQRPLCFFSIPILWLLDEMTSGLSLNFEKLAPTY